MYRLTILIIASFILISSCNKDENLNEESYLTIINGNIGVNDNSMIKTIDGNLALCGNYGGNGLIIKSTSQEDQLWEKYFYFGNMSTISSLAEINTGELFLCGETYRNWDNSQSDMLLVKANMDGDTIWSKTYGGSEKEYGSNIIATSDGNLLLVGKTESFGARAYGDIFLVKVDIDGEIIWSKNYSDPDQEISYSVIESVDGEYLITGTNEDGNSPGLFMLMIDSKGDELWSNTIGAGESKYGYSSIFDSNNEIITCGTYRVDGYGQILVIKSDNEGNIIWEKTYGEEYLSEEGNSIKQDDDGAFIIVGSVWDVAKMDEDIVILKIDQNGEELWFKKFGSKNRDCGSNIISLQNGEFVLSGTYNESIFITKIDNKGNFLW